MPELISVEKVLAAGLKQAQIEVGVIEVSYEVVCMAGACHRLRGGIEGQGLGCLTVEDIFQREELFPYIQLKRTLLHSLLEELGQM